LSFSESESYSIASENHARSNSKSSRTGRVQHKESSNTKPKNGKSNTPQLTPSSSFLQGKTNMFRDKLATNSSSSITDRRSNKPSLNDSKTRYLNDYSKTNEGLQEIDSKLKSLQLLLKNNVI
jgi:hypothetical protein